MVFVFFFLFFFFIKHFDRPRHIPGELPPAVAVGVVCGVFSFFFLLFCSQSENASFYAQLNSNRVFFFLNTNRKINPQSKRIVATAIVMPRKQRTPKFVFPVMRNKYEILQFEFDLCVFSSFPIVLWNFTNIRSKITKTKYIKVIER